MKPTFEYITTEATDREHNWSLKAKAQFEYFNPRGLYARKRRNDQAISRLVEEGKATSGAILAHGTFADFEAKALQVIAMKKRITGIEYRVAVNMLTDHCAAQEKFIATLSN